MFELIHPDNLNEIDYDIQNAIFSLMFVLCKEDHGNKTRIGSVIFGGTDEKKYRVG